MGCLAVYHAFKGQGLGGALLADALGRTARADIAAFAMMVVWRKVRVPYRDL